MLISAVCPARVQLPPPGYVASAHHTPRLKTPQNLAADSAGTVSVQASALSPVNDAMVLGISVCAGVFTWLAFTPVTVQPAMVKD